MCLLYPVPDWDIKRVLITHMGFVTIVLLAPAIIEDQKLIAVLLCSTMSQIGNQSIIPSQLV